MKNRIVVVLVAVALLAGCGGGTKSDSASETTIPEAENSVAVESSPVETSPVETDPPVTTTEAPALASTYEVLDDRAWKLLNKNPDAQAGAGVLLYGKIIQFDARTGPTTFKAIVYRNQAARSADGSLTNFTIADISGDESMLSTWLAEDNFSCECTIIASQEYTTQNQETRLSILMNAKSLTQG